MAERTPELAAPWGYPDWFHHHGNKVEVFNLDLKGRGLILKASAAHLTVGPHPANPDRWIVAWEVHHRGAQVAGETSMSTELLRRAFGLTDETERAGEWLIDRYGGDTAFPGIYIRWHDCLNIPCPGTGGDGDPNISILLTNEIKEAVRQLLEQRS